MQGIEATFDDAGLDRGRDSRPLFNQIVPGAVALAVSACIGAVVLHGRPAATPEVVPAPVAKVDANPYGVIYDPGFLFSAKIYGSLPKSLAPEGSLQASLEAAPVAAPPQTVPLLPPAPLPPKRDVASLEEAAPLPPPRPPEFGAAAPDRRAAPHAGPAAPPAAAPDNRSFIQKLFGLGQSSGTVVARTPPDSRVAVAAPLPAPVPMGRSIGNALFTPSTPVPGYDKYTAVYDISARTVYLPDGTRMEAHSGYGDKLDDPRYVSEHMRGATPPHAYELEPREGSFHGVQALRLKPIGDGDLFGRAGLLAHPFMLGPNGDSNGCVSIKDYDAFLRAYQNGQVKKLVVVARLD